MAYQITRLRILTHLGNVVRYKLPQQTCHKFVHSQVSPKNLARYVSCPRNYLCIKVCSQLECFQSGRTAFHTCLCVRADESTDDAKAAAAAAEQKKKEKLASRIHLLDSNGNPMGIMKKSEALLLAKNNDQLLVEISPTTFKLVDQKEASSKKAKAGSKQSPKAKQLIIKSKITEHDLQVKLKHVTNWLEKEHEVIIIINNTDPNQPEKMSHLLQAITQTCKELAVVKQLERTEELMRLSLKPKSDTSKTNKPPEVLKFSEMKKTNPK